MTAEFIVIQTQLKQTWHQPQNSRSNNYPAQPERLFAQQPDQQSAPACDLPVDHQWGRSLPSEPSKPLSETERVEMWEPHQSRIPNFELAECEALHSHYLEQLATCHAQARPMLRSLLTRLEDKMLALMT
jgi:hypothetical protein